MTTDQRQMAAHVKARAIPGVDYESVELGPAHDTSPDDVLTALTLPPAWCHLRPGRGTMARNARRRAQPAVHGHGVPDAVGRSRQWRIRAEPQRLPPRNFVTDMMISGSHTGTHLDALSHITVGEDDAWHGGYTAAESLGDFGPMRAESSSIPPFVCRGVLIDVANARGGDVLPAGELITAAELQGTLRRQHAVIRRGDAVLIRTGYMQVWGTPSHKSHVGAGIGRDAGLYLADQAPYWWAQTPKQWSRRLQRIPMSR